MAAIGYARVSTRDQSPQLQLDALTNAGCERLFVEHASGKNADRPELAACFDHLRTGDVLVVWKLDRLGRNLRHLIDVVNELAERGVQFRSLTESIDTTTAPGKLLFNIMGSLAEFERDLIRERTRAGLEAARKADRRPGRKFKLAEKDVRWLVDSWDKLTVDDIAHKLRVSPATVYRAYNRAMAAKEAESRAS